MAGDTLRREVQMYVMLTSFIVTSQRHEREALTYRALIPTIPAQPSKFLTTQVFDTF
jgi:hypothetical protein